LKAALLIDMVPGVWDFFDAQSARGRTDALKRPTKHMMTYNLKRNRRCGFVRGRGSDAGTAISQRCRSAEIRMESWKPRGAGSRLALGVDCKYLISRQLPDFFTIPGHFSHASHWFLAGCRETGGFFLFGSQAVWELENTFFNGETVAARFYGCSGCLRLFPAQITAGACQAWGRFAGCNWAALGLDSSQ
jgi:hypothetical protein